MMAAAQTIPAGDVTASSALSLPSPLAAGALPASLVGQRVLGSELVFVFGSNLQGRHGKGAAAHAARYFAAKHGVGEGPMIDQDGLLRSYALPTKREPLMGPRLSLETIASFAEDFKVYAQDVAPMNYQFQLTRVGCGLAGYNDHEMLPLFADAPSNVILPGRWAQMLDCRAHRFIVAGSRDYADEHRVWLELERITLPYWTEPGFEIVSGMARGPDLFGVSFAEEYALGDRLVRFPAEWALYDKPAGHIRNAVMAWYATDLIAFWDGKSPGTRGMIDLAQREGLNVHVVRV